MKRPLVLVGVLGGVALAGIAVQWNRARVEASIRRMDRATLEERLKASPDDPELFARMGHVLVEDNEPLKALPLLEVASKAFPDRAEIVVDQIRAMPDPNSGDAIAEQYLNRHPKESTVAAERLRIRLRVGDPIGTLAAIDALPKAEAEAPRMRELRGETLLMLRRLPEAVETLSLAVPNGPAPRARLLLARALVPLQRYREVVSACAPLLAPEAAGLSEVTRARARLYSSGSRLFGPTSVAEREDIRRNLESVAAIADRLEPEEAFLPAWFLGECLMRSGRPNDALVPLRQATALAPEFPGAWFARARAAKLAGKTPEAAWAFVVHRGLGKRLSAAENAAERAAQAPNDRLLAAIRNREAAALARFVGTLPRDSGKAGGQKNKPGRGPGQDNGS